MRPAGYSSDFGPFGERVWLNAAHQGPLPRVAVAAGERALAEKAVPSRMRDDAFVEVPERLRVALAQLVRGSPNEIVLGNSASYGLDVLAHGLPWRAGDEVLLPAGEFPASVFPWRVLERQGVEIRLMPTDAPGVIDPDRLEKALTSRTRVFCASWVNSFTGHVADVDVLGRVCQERGVWFVLNASQGLGARALEVRTLTVDAVTCCGYKWLLGPYGTGFLWVAPALRERLQPLHTYWLPNVWGQPGGMQRYATGTPLGVRALDVSCPANFLDVVPWTASLEYLLGVGVAAVEELDKLLVERLTLQLERARDDGLPFDVVSPAARVNPSPLVVVRPKPPLDAASLHAALASAGIDTALREGAVRLSPHLYNTVEDIDRAAATLVELAHAAVARGARRTPKLT